MFKSRTSGLILIFSLFSILASNTHAAAVRYYDFEIIIFESQNQEASISENWGKPPELEIPEKYVVLGRPYPGQMPRKYSSRHTFKILPSSTYKLTQQAKLLTEKGNNKILLHIAWRQPGMPSDTALPIRFKYNFNKVATTVAPTNDAAIKTDPVSDTDPAPILAQEPAQTINPHTLDGFIKIILSRYLHADIRLQYSTQVPVTVPVAPAEDANFEIETEAETERATLVERTFAPVTYQFQQTRKMRSKEIHYLDHPVLGILILATPYLGNSLKPN